MPTPMKCPGCQASFDVPDHLAGKTIRCTSCKTQLTVPAAGGMDIPDDDEPRPAAKPAAKAAVAVKAAVKAAPAVNGKSGPVRVEPKGRPVSTAKASRRRADDDEDDDEDDEDERPVRKGKGKGKKAKSGSSSSMPLLIGGGVLGLLVLVVVAVLVMSGGGKKDEGSGNDTAGGGTATPGGDSGWKAAAQGDGFTIDFPGAPSISGSLAAGRKYLYAVNKEKEIYEVDVIQLPANQGADANAILTASANEVKKEVSRYSFLGSIKDRGESNISQDGFPGKELKYSEGRKAGIVVRIVLATDRMYVLVVGGDDLALGSDKMQRCVDSFKITYRQGGSSKPPSEPVASAPRPMTPPAVDPNPAPPSPPTEPVAAVPPMPPGTDPTQVPPMPGTPPGTPDVPGMPPGVPGMPPVPAEARPPLHAKISPFTAIVFDPEKGDAYTLAPRTDAKGKVAGTLTRYSYPEFKETGRYKLSTFGTRAVIDPAKGVLYFASVSTTNQATARMVLQKPFDRVSALGDVHAVDLKPLRAGEVAKDADVKTTPMVVGGVIAGLEVAPDGKAVYVLVTRTQGARSTATVHQYDPAERKKVKSKDMPGPAWDMRTSADGKKLLVLEQLRANAGPVGAPVGGAAPGLAPGGGVPGVAPGNAPAGQPLAVFVLDTEAWEVKGERLPGAACDIAASATGPQVVAVAVGGDPRQGRLFVVDGGAGQDATAAGHVSLNNYVAFTRSGKHLLVTSFAWDPSAGAAGNGGGLGGGAPTVGGIAHPGLDVYEVTDPSAATGFQKVASLRQSGGPSPAVVGGFPHVSPDSLHVAFQNGAVLEVAKLAETEPGPEIVSPLTAPNSPFAGPAPTGPPPGFNPQPQPPQPQPQPPQVRPPQPRPPQPRPPQQPRPRQPFFRPF